LTVKLGLVELSLGGGDDLGAEDGALDLAGQPVISRKSGTTA
jgi:hypothetical protein